MPVNQKILNAFDNAHKKRSAVKHPLYASDIRLRTVFVHAAALVACVDGELTEREELERLAHLLDLPSEMVDQAVSSAEAAESDLVESILDTVTERSEQVLLILDLYHIAFADGVLGPEEGKVIDLTCKMLKIPKFNMDFFRKFALLISLQEQKSIHDLLNSVGCANVGIDPDHVPYLLQFTADKEWEAVGNINYKEANALGLIYIDQQAGLMWIKNGNVTGKLMTWSEAKISVSEKNEYAGYNDWRLPSIDEFESLIKLGTNNIIEWMNVNGFSNVKESVYWSGTEHDRSRAWGVAFQNKGQKGSYSKSERLYVLAVRFID